MLRIAILALLLATRAGAGAWPLPEGEGHLSLSLEGDGDGSGAYASLYTEYGIGRGRVTGLDLGLSHEDPGKAVLFMRWPFAPGSGGDTRMAYELGLGLIGTRAALRPGLSLGRGIELGHKPGWVAFDARAVLFEGKKGRIEAELTLGADTGHGDKWLVQLQMAAPGDAAPYVKFAPSYAFDLGNDRHLLVGVTAGMLGIDDVMLSLGLWQKF